MKVAFPKDSYLKNIEVNSGSLDISFASKKKVALLFISLNEGYWPYLTQVIKDARQNFLPQHHVDYFVWTDFNEEREKQVLDAYDESIQKITDQAPMELLNSFAGLTRLYSYFYPQLIQGVVDMLAQKGIMYCQEGLSYKLESTHTPGKADFLLIGDACKTILTFAFDDFKETTKNAIVTETGSVAWPAPTLMRYHLFLSQEKLKDYDYIFYMDADMRIVSKISDEILGDGLTAAPHPGYAVSPKFIPPYEPNPASEAYIPRLGRIQDVDGKKRFIPFYAAGGFQGGTSQEFLQAMERMKERIDKDFDNNYMAIWNDESHWNKYLLEYKKEIIFLDPSYVYPDSLIKEYYEPLWGRSYEPKIITLTKPFSLSAQGGQELKSLVVIPK